MSEFHEDLKRLSISIVRPNINKCYADFFSNGKNFFYALGAIKNVGFEAISNVVKERITNGEFKNLNDFINRVNPKDINKLQLEGLVQSGAFDDLHANRQALFNSIPNIILKSKNIHENNSNNQIDLFGLEKDKEVDFIEKTDDWISDIKLTKEFETLGFYISDHPINQYKSIFNQYNITSYEEFDKNNDILSSNIACTILKTQEKKTQKGGSYAIVKFSDLSNVLNFYFSDVFELNRDNLKEGNSVMITLIKNYSDETKSQKRLNVKKIISLKEVVNKPVKNLSLKFNNFEDVNIIKNLSKSDGKTSVKLIINKNNQLFTFYLKDKRKVNNKLLNTLNLVKNVVTE